MDSIRSEIPLRLARATDILFMIRVPYTFGFFMHGVSGGSFRMTYSLEFIRLRVVARVAWIEFNRAPVNAFNREMVDEVHEAIATALADPEVRVLVIASVIDDYFSA